MQTCYEVITDSRWEIIKEIVTDQRKRKYNLRDVLMLYFIFYEQVHNGEIFPIIILLGRQFTTISGSGKRTEPLNVSILI